MTRFLRSKGTIAETGSMTWSFVIIGMFFSQGVLAQDGPPGVYTQLPTDQQGYYTSPLPPPAAPPSQPMDYGGNMGPPVSHAEQPQETYAPPPVSYSPPMQPTYDPILQTGSNTLGTSKYQRPEKRKRFHPYSPYTDVVMLIRAQEDPLISDHIRSLREEGLRKRKAAREQRLLRREERRARELARINFVRERAVLQPMDPAARREAFRKYLEEKRRYQESREYTRQSFVQEQRARKTVQRKVRLEGRQRLLSFQRGEMSRQNRAIASPQSQPRR